MYTYSGVHVTPAEGVPKLEDIALHLGRICRFAGGTREFWPVLLHTLCVWSLADGERDPDNPRIPLVALLHDATESVMGDVPRPFKSPEYRDMEHELEFRIYESLGLKVPLLEEADAVKKLDDRVLFGELHTVGPPRLKLEPKVEGTDRKIRRDLEAESLVVGMGALYPVHECIMPNGAAVLQFIQLVKEEIDGLK